MKTIYLMTLGFLFVSMNTLASDKYSAIVQGLKYFQAEGSKDYRAIRSASLLCQQDPKGLDCDNGSADMLDSNHWLADVIGTKRFKAYGSKPYRALLQARLLCHSAGFDYCSSHKPLELETYQKIISEILEALTDQKYEDAQDKLETTIERLENLKYKD